MNNEKRVLDNAIASIKWPDAIIWSNRSQTESILERKQLVFKHSTYFK